MKARKKCDSSDQVWIMILKFVPYFADHSTEKITDFRVNTEKHGDAMKKQCKCIGIYLDEN